MSFVSQFKKHYYSWSAFQRLAFCFSISSFISVGLLVFATLNRIRSGSSIGIMLPFSAAIVLLGFLASIILWRKSTQSQNKIEQRTVIPLYIFNSPLSVPLFWVLINIFVFTFGIIVIFNTQLFGRAYLSFLPTLFICFSFTLTVISFLIKYSPSIILLTGRLRSLSAQEIFLFLLTCIGFIYTGWFISITLIPRAFPIFLILLKHQEILLCSQLFIILTITNLVLFSIRAIPIRYKTATLLFHSNDTIFQTDKKRNYECLFSFLISFLFFCVYLLIFPIAYDTNDDILIVQLLSGYIGGVPQEFPVYSNVILGLLFRYLFNINNQINWVVIFYLVIDFLSIWSLIYTFLSARINLLSKFFGITVIFLFNIYFLSALTYTTISAISSLAGLLAINSMILEKKTVFSSQYWTGLVFLIIGCLIRFEAACMVVLLFIPLVIFNLKQFLNNRKAVLCILLPALIISTSILFNHYYLVSHPAWYDYVQYNKIHQQLRDTPRSQSLEKSVTLQQSVEWSQNDTYLFTYWFNLDQQVVSESKMRSLVTQISNWNSDISETLNALKSTLLNFPTLDFLYFSLACFIVFLLSSRKSKSLFCALLIIFILSFVFIILSWGYKLPPRVCIPMLFTFSILVLLLPAWNEKNCYSVIPNETSRIIFTSGIFMVVILLFFGRHLFSRPFEQKQEFTARHEYYDKILTEINSQYSKGIFTENSLVLAPDASFPFFSMNPYSIDFPKVDILSGGWNSFSPLYDAQFKQHDLSIEPVSYIDEPDLYILSYSMMMSNVEQFYFEHYGINITCDPVYVLGESGPIDLSENPIVIYKINTKEN